MPTPTYIDPAAAQLREGVIKICSQLESGLGLEREVSFATRLTGKRYGLMAIATSVGNTGGRSGTIRGKQEYQLNLNYQYVVVVPSKVPPDNDISSLSFLNGETAYHLQQFRGFIDHLNATTPDGSEIAEIRVQSLDTIFSQQAKEPYAYEITILGTLGLLYYVRKGMFGEPLDPAIERTPDSFIDYWFYR